MTDYVTLFDTILPTKDMPNAIFSLSENAINNLLRAHRTLDHQMYHHKEELKDTATKNTFFSMDVVVGGELTTNSKAAEPLVIKLYNTKNEVTSATMGNTLVYQYPSRHEARAAGINPSPNVVIGATNINFYLEWPKSGPDGGVWKEHIKNVAFTMEAYLDIEETDGSDSRDDTEKVLTQLKIIPISLFVGQSDLDRIRQQLSERLDGDQQAIGIGRVSDLIVSLFSFAATKIGPNLVQEIPLPVAQISGYDVYPSFMKIHSEVVTIGATLELNEENKRLIEQAYTFRVQYQLLLEQDIAIAGGWDKVMFTDNSLQSFYALPDRLRHKGVNKLVFRKDKEIEAMLARSEAFVLSAKEGVTRQLKHKLASHNIDNSKKGTGSSVVKKGMAVAINEYFLDSIVSQMGNIDNSDQTKTIKVLDSVKGNLGYRLYVGTPDIDITNGGVAGSVDIDTWAGLNYAYREYHRCSTSWSKWKRAGVGINGRPQLKIKTLKSAGLSLLASFNLSNLKLYTGVALLDKLIKPLSKLFFKGIEGVLNILALMLSFVVIPAKFSSKSMNTALSVSNVETKKYKRSGGPNNSSNNYLLIIADVEGKKS